MSWFKRTWMTAAVVATFGASVVGAWAQSKGLDLDLADADLAIAIQSLSRQTGLQFVIADRDKTFHLITLSLRDVSPEKAIELVCKAAGAYAERDAGGVYIIHFGAKPETTTNVTRPVDPGLPIPKIRTKITPRHWDALEILQQMTGTFEFDPYQGLRESQRVQTFWTPQRSQNTNIYLPSNGTNIYGSPSNTPSGPVTNPTTENANNIWTAGDDVRQFGGGGQPGGGSGGGGFGGGGFGGGGQPGGGGGANGGGTRLQGGQGLVPAGIDSITYDPSDNSFIVVGTDDAIRQLRQVIDLFDTAPKQVEIKVEFITTSTSVSKSFGFDWQYSRGAIFTGVNPGTFARTGDPIFINYSTGNLVTRLRAQLLDGEGKVVTAPIVRTFNNQTAAVVQQIQTTYFVPNITGSAGGNIVTYQPQTLPINTALIVRPRINDDGYVTMSLTPQISDLGQVRRAPDGQEVPDVLTQFVSVSTRVRDNDTIVLGGLNRTQTFSNNNRFPILSDLPIVGQFFRSTRQERNDQELLIFVTPHIIKDDEDLSPMF